MKIRLNSSNFILLGVALGVWFMVALGTGCTQQDRARRFGGTQTIDLAPGVKLVNVTWKPEGSLWVLTRPMRTGETPEEYHFKENSNFGVIQGTVILREKR